MSTIAGLPSPVASPVIENLYRRVEQTMGIKAAGDALEKLREDLEQQYGKNCFETPDFYDRILSFPEDIFTAARLLTINETYFFREEAYFELLRKELLPRLARLARPLRVCSAATSIGCEAYSLAMVMDDYSRTVQPLNFGIDAFDVNPEAVETAKKGRYTENALRDDGARWKFLLDRYTRIEGPDFVIDSVLRSHIRFYTHNLLNGFMGNHYDLIFFRNALIYFSPDKRKVILDYLADALLDGGFLVLGVSETPGVNHPLLLSQHVPDTFYFQKISETPHTATSASTVKPVEIRAKSAALPTESPAGDHRGHGASKKAKHGPETPAAVSPSEAAPGDIRKKPVISQPEPEGIAVLIDDHEGGHPIEGKLPELFRGAAKGAESPPTENRAGITGDEFFAGVIYLLGQEDFSGADRLLTFIEQHNNSAFTHFLRGEYHYFNNRKKEAELSYREAAGKNDAFWPAFYRLSVLASEGNPVQYEYKTRKALESINRGKDLRYEIFIGGFSPDYYRRALEKRLGG
ncbi:MAG: chemotaxis protein CheR [Spirochaetaceae bacterium]|jgi:chemotaxis protein methyltransferase CheR|nr:chemotaxis protein CheR [Spirochaetaceae bacterium]